MSDSGRGTKVVDFFTRSYVEARDDAATAMAEERSDELEYCGENTQTLYVVFLASGFTSHCLTCRLR